MSYTPYLIANFATGLENRLQPWLLADDAQEELYDGYVYRGVLSKREGYNYYAIGQQNSQPYTESRMVDQRQSVALTGAINSSNMVFTGTLVTPVRRGTVVVTGSNPSQTFTDNGLGAFTGAGGSINYTTGALTITLPAAPTAGTVTVTYDYFPGDPVMGIMTFISTNNTKELLVADTRRVNLYDAHFNILRPISTQLTITGITVANPGVVTTSAAHNLLTGDKVFIYNVAGMTQVNGNTYTITVTSGTTFSIVDTSGFSAYTSGGFAEVVYTGDNSNFWSWVNYKDGSNNPRLIFTNNKDEVQYYAPHLTPPIGDYVNYPTAAAPEFHMQSDATPPVDITSLAALLVFEFKDRLLLLRTTENGVVKPQRIRISGTGTSSDDFRTSATGAGFIDIPDGAWIMGATYNRDDLLIFTEYSTWVLKYTGNDTTPFVLNKIDESRGCQAPFSAFTYLNRSSAASPRGLIISDGYRVERQDNDIPDFTFNEIDGDNFDLCFAGVVDADRDHYLIYPTQNQNNQGGIYRSDRILTTNYDEDNYSIYRLPLSCMGTFISQKVVTWDDLLVYNSWDEMATVYGNWNSFSYSKGNPFSLGGGHKGELWQLNQTEEEDNPVKIRNIVVLTADTIQVTTDWNNYSKNSDDPEKGTDTIYLTGILGMEELNNKQYSIVDFIDYNNFVLEVKDTALLSAYTGSGVATRVIPFSSLFKKFNPFVQQNQRVRCGWLYMYVDASDTKLTRNIAIDAASQSNPCIITTNVAHNLKTGDQITIFGITGMTELNGIQAFVTVLTSTTFSLNGIDSSAYTAYVSGGYACVGEKAKMVVEVITNDNPAKTQPDYNTNLPYRGTVSNLYFEYGSKKWYKIFINQVGNFIQFRCKNLQAGAKINIQAVMPGFQGTGRIY